MSAQATNRQPAKVPALLSPMKPHPIIATFILSPVFAALAGYYTAKGIDIGIFEVVQMIRQLFHGSQTALMSFPRDSITS